MRTLKSYPALFQRGSSITARITKSFSEVVRRQDTRTEQTKNTVLNLMLTLRVAIPRGALTKSVIRAFSTAPASDPLELMQATFMKRGMCDGSGFRLPGVHWTMALAFGADDPMKVGIALLDLKDFFRDVYVSNDTRLFVISFAMNNSLPTFVLSEFSAFLIWASTLS